MPKRLIVNADDFGRSSSINRAVVEAHRRGILTSASLMVNESGCEEAVALARENANLGVGLHLSLVCGRAALGEADAPGLVDERGQLPNDPVRAGVRFALSSPMRRRLRDEIHAQFRRFDQTGLPLDHVNGHLNIHLHPVVLDILLADAERLGIRRIRLTRDSLGTSLRLGRGRWAYRVSHWLIFQLLCGRARPALRESGILHTDRVFGMLEDGQVTEGHLRRLLARLPEGVSELYSHPSMDKFKHEYEALVSPEVRALVERERIQLIRYRDLDSSPARARASA